MHLVYFCDMNKSLVTWMENFLKHVCIVKTKKFLKVLKLDYVAHSKKDRNTAMLLLSDYITGIWYGHKLGILTDESNRIEYVKARIYKTRFIIMKEFGEKCNEVVTANYIRNESWN